MKCSMRNPVGIPTLDPRKRCVVKRSTLSIGIPLCLLILFIVIILGSAGEVISTQPLESLYNYSGTIGDIQIRMTLILDGVSVSDTFTGKQVTGTYFYVKWLKDIEIRGDVDSERNFIFYEYDKAGNITGRFKGRFPETDPRGNSKSRIETEVLIGTWSRPDGTDGKPFYLGLDTITPREKGKGRYFDVGVEDDEAFEKKVRQFRTAVISGNKQVVADMINYPIVVTIAGKKRSLSGRAAVVANYDRIFSHNCVEAVRKSVPHNMFSRYNGVMLDHAGLIWFGDDGKVIAINNNLCAPH